MAARQLGARATGFERMRRFEHIAFAAPAVGASHAATS
jgi:hypothetical protein